MHPSTRVVRSSLTPAIAGDALNTGPVFAAPFHAPGDPEDITYSYAASHNPTWTALEAALAAMEHPEAKALIFASGSAAIAAVFGSMLRPNDTVVLADDAYFGTRSLLSGYLREMGVHTRAVSQGDLGRDEHLRAATLLWLETPSNPNLGISDIRALCNAAQRTGAIVTVDNTTATPFGQSPLTCGADLSVVSGSKALCGHNDLLLGHVATLRPELMARLEAYRNRQGNVLGPMEAWLALRSLLTLPLRLERMCANAQSLAQFLQTRPEVRDVLYPGLPTHPGHEIAARQMAFFGPIVCFTLRDQGTAEAFLGKSELITEATSFGGISTTAERRARWKNDRVPPGFIRLSAGCEHIDDLLADISQALVA